MSYPADAALSRLELAARKSGSVSARQALKKGPSIGSRLSPRYDPPE
jgi:hypothetical protein